MKKFYLDTSIWRDYFEDRKDNLRPLGEFAFQLLNYCKKNKYQILYSRVVIEELLKQYSQEQINDFFLPYKNSMKKINVNERISIKAVELGKELNMPINDIAHALLAKQSKATLVSRDKHFEELQDIVEVRFPEEII